MNSLVTVKELDEIASLRDKQGARGLNGLARYIRFVKERIECHRDERRVERQYSARVTYLLDFEVIFSYMAPYLRPSEPVDVRDSGHQLQRANYLSAADFFESSIDEYGIPPGTIAEIANFLHGQAARISHLSAVRQASSFEAAFSEFRAFFEKEDFLMDSSEVGIRLQYQKSDQERLLGLQTEALQLLARRHTAMQRLLRLVSSTRLVDIYQPLSEKPFSIPRDPYGDFLAAIRKLRGDHSRRFVNIADAYNLAFMLRLNELTSETVSKGTNGSALRIFKLLTNTSTLHKLKSDHRPNVSVHLTLDWPDGTRIKLLEESDEALAARALRRHFPDPVRDEFVDLITVVHRADEGQQRLDALRRRNHLDFDQLLRQATNPETMVERDRVLQCKGFFDDINSLFERSDEVFGPILARRVRADLVPGIRGADEFSSLQQEESLSIVSLQETVASIFKALEQIDTLGYHLSPIQEGADPSRWSNPLASLENLGYSEIQDKVGDSFRWTLVKSTKKRPSFVVNRYHDGTWSLFWPSETPAPRAVEITKEVLIELCSEDELTLAITSATGEKKCFRGRIIALSLASDAEVALVRIESASFAIVQEVYSPNRKYWLKSGVVTDRPIPDLRLVSRLFFALSKHRPDCLFRRLFSRRLLEVITGWPSSKR